MVILSMVWLEQLFDMNIESTFVIIGVEEEGILNA